MSKLTKEEIQNLINEYHDTNNKKQMLVQRLQAIQAVIAKDEIERKAIYDEITTLNTEIKELDNNLSRVENIIAKWNKKNALIDKLIYYPIICIIVIGGVVGCLNKIHNEPPTIDYNKTLEERLAENTNVRLVCDYYFKNHIAQFEGSETGEFIDWKNKNNKTVELIFVNAKLANGFGAKLKVSYSCYISKKFPETIGETEFIETIAGSPESYYKYVVDFKVYDNIFGQ